ncbi:hypothetical protein U732_2368 [Clostridium argentinense CDC 2741]|uniref:Uncharacterized protein n=1 Tax=Clostridium argentinense CDC 2741 TaxID=1418104 RepID=A0A0C1QXH5_9CLOT|nr:hypothetical protein [Clostridium argentinense]ARC83447.1 hypothetical protein RSJ17_02270 [Clostridium argentinense]KIE45712.1 hypothetical protein U732_2368 [Clostridium argentinense CDC 2741]NFF39107.1 hypothetical protein [Clostridium argentinense]NFP49519.1 hypothetical protein [Clostridium argentinense]NFP72222.1 hypothetical protein [Clostridium argentinense]
MIILRNYFDISSKIVLYDNEYKIEDINSPINGVGGVADDNILYGLYVDNGKLFFIIDTKAYELNKNNINCSNKYITATERMFIILSSNQEICGIRYKPFVDPGMIYYDIDEDEFDVLLYISSLLKDNETIDKFVRAMSKNS